MNNSKDLKLFKTKTETFESSNSNKFVHFIYVVLKHYVFTNIHIAFVGTVILFLFSSFLKKDVPKDFYILIFNSILSYYCLHWFISSQKIKTVRDHWTSKNKKTLILLSFVAACVVLSVFYKNLDWIIYFLPTILSAIAYTFFAHFLFKAFTPRFKAAFITLFWTYTLTILPSLIFGIESKFQFIYSAQIAYSLAITSIITLIFEERDIQKNEFNLSLNELIEEKSKLIRTRNVFFIVASLVCLILVFSSFFSGVFSSIFLGLINFTCVCLLYLFVNKYKNNKGWIYFDLLLDSALIFAALGNLLF